MSDIDGFLSDAAVAAACRERRLTGHVPLALRLRLQRAGRRDKSAAFAAFKSL
jgi:hypothetical protein